MSLLVDLGIVRQETDGSKVFEDLFPGKTFQSVDYSNPRDYIRLYWEAFCSLQRSSLNGVFFELVIYTLLYREGVLPFYTQAKVAFVPNIIYDTILYNKSMPVALSLKTSLRERYKQADLEAIALKYVHRRAKSYLLTLNSQEASAQKRKIDNGEIIGIDQIIDCNTDDIDVLIRELKAIPFQKSETVDVVEGLLVGRNIGG